MARTKKTEEEKQEIFNKNKKYLIELENSTKSENGIYKLRYPLCIMTCHNRKPSILDNLDQFGDSQINVFIYDFENEMYSWLDRKNVNKIYVPKEYLSCQKMRVFIQGYMGDKKYWVTDDDLKCVMMHNDKHKIDIGHALRMLEEFSEGKGYGTIGYGHVELGVKFWNGDLVSDTYASVTLLYDGKIINEHGLKYTGDENVDESLEYVINSHICGIPVKNCVWGCLVCYEPSGGKHSLASKPEHHLHMQECLYIKYGDYVRIGLENRRGYTAHCRYGSFNKEKTYNEELLKLCKAGDHEGVLNYLKAKKSE